MRLYSIIYIYIYAFKKQSKEQKKCEVSLSRLTPTTNEEEREEKKRGTIRLSFFTSSTETNTYKGDEHMEKALAIVCQNFFLLRVDKH